MQKALQMLLQIAGYLTTAAGVAKLVPDILTALSSAFTAAATFDYGALVASVTVVATGLGLLWTAIHGKNAETARAAVVITRARALLEFHDAGGPTGTRNIGARTNPAMDEAMAAVKALSL